MIYTLSKRKWRLKTEGASHETKRACAELGIDTHRVPLQVVRFHAHVLSLRHLDPILVVVFVALPGSIEPPDSF
jgi:hypothetical protein